MKITPASKIIGTMNPNTVGRSGRFMRERVIDLLILPGVRR